MFSRKIVILCGCDFESLKISWGSAVEQEYRAVFPRLFSMQVDCFHDVLSKKNETLFTPTTVGRTSVL
jgi:hypothetical protein